jgi:hypothetical protein
MVVKLNDRCLGVWRNGGRWCGHSEPSHSPHKSSPKLGLALKIKHARRVKCHFFLLNVRRRGSPRDFAPPPLTGEIESRTTYRPSRHKTLPRPAQNHQTFAILVAHAGLQRPLPSTRALDRASRPHRTGYLARLSRLRCASPGLMATPICADPTKKQSRKPATFKSPLVRHN